MNSKECLERIIFEAKLDKPIFSVYYQELIEAKEKIVKDLEVLEILKKVFKYKSVQQFVDNMTKDEFFRVKEWLEE